MAIVSNPNSKYVTTALYEEVCKKAAGLVEKNDILRTENSQLKEIIAKYDAKENFKPASNLQLTAAAAAAASATQMQMRIDKSMFGKMFVTIRNAKEWVELQTDKEGNVVDAKAT